MKLLHWKVNKSTLLLAFNLILVFLSAFIILANRNTRQELEESKRGFYSKGASYLFCDDSADWETVRGILSGQEWISGILFKKDLEIGADTRGVFYKGKISVPPLLSGRFFTPKESWGKEKKALVGTRFEKDIYNKNGKQYIEIFGEPFEVIGILGSSQPTRLDSMKWIPLETAVELTGVPGRYAVDGISEAVIKNNTELLWTVMDEDWTMQKTEAQKTFQELNKFGDINIIEKIYLAIICVFALNMILAGNYWMRQKNQKVQVERLLGFSSAAVIFSIFTEFLSIAGISILIVGAVIVCLTLFGLISAVGIFDYCLFCGVIILAEILIVSIRMAFYILRTKIILRRV